MNPLSMEFSRQEDWSGLPFSSPGDLPDPGIEPRDRTQGSGVAADTLPSEPPGKAIHSFQKDLVLDDLSIIELPNLELIEKNSETR